MINASLFALIQNDAFLSGTYGLEGHRFINTVQYLKEYFDTLKIGSEPLSPEYLELIQDVEDLVKVEHDLEDHFLGHKSKTSGQIAATIANDLKKLPFGAKKLIPGGWHDKDGGHAMAYQFIRERNGFRFVVFNSGAGIKYHAKKSTNHKELYNPTKTWLFPMPKTPKDENELSNFIERLLKARLPNGPGQRVKGMSAKVLYEEILPSISYLHGEETDANDGFPEHGYTGGQLSGTCAQRCIHQMLKVNSTSEDAFQRFIFKFKIHALQDYANACLTGKQPFNHAVAEQIYLAIENNLKILNTPGIFTESEINYYFDNLTDLKQDVGSAHLSRTISVAVLSDATPQLTLRDNPLFNASSSFSSVDNYEEMPVPFTLKNGTNLLVNIEKALRTVKSVRDPAAQYFYLEKLILSLPLNQSPTFYSEIRTLEDCGTFQKNIHEVQDLLNNLRQTWLKEAQNSRFNHIVLSVLSLQIDMHTAIAAKSHMPSFKVGTDTMMSALIDNHHRDPFEATNHPIIDQRIAVLRTRFNKSSSISDSELEIYYKDILDTEPVLYNELKDLYQAGYGDNTARLHKEIRTKDLGALFLISLHLKNEKNLPAKFNSLIDKIKAHHAYESRLRETINPFFEQKLSTKVHISTDFLHDKLKVISPLYPTYVAYQDLSKTITQHKYVLKDSPAREALEADFPNKTAVYKPVRARTANHIQLHPVKFDGDDVPHNVTQADIIARDYYHLRSEPSLQIVLTLDYFTRNVHKLADEANQCYVEANVFQSGLLLAQIDKGGFLPQFDTYLKTGKRFFSQNGQYSRDSVQFLRLDFLLSRYMVQKGLPQGSSRLKQIQEELEKQLALAQNPDVIYVLQQYLFLSFIARIEAGESSSELFAQTFNAYFYIMGHTNPSILEDTAHTMDVAQAIVQFKILAGQQTELTLKQAVQSALISSKQGTKFELKGKFPTYNVLHDGGKSNEINVVSGKLFERGLCRTGIPLAIQNHPLIKQLGVQNERECLMNADGTYMILKHKNEEIYLFYKNNSLTVQKEWTVNGKVSKYELQALSADHLAKHANKLINPITTDLPKPLTDGGMNYWKSITNRYEGLLICNNIPAYSFKGGIFRLIDEQGKETSSALSQLDLKWTTLLNSFESNLFLISSQDLGKTATKITLPRFGLNFTFNELRDELLYQETGEKVITGSSPIHAAVAGLVLEGQGRTRYLVPVQRFYATENNAQASDFYPLIHDTNGTIANCTLAEYWKSKPPLHTPLWHYQHSERYVSFQLKDGTPIADKPADALYLVYIYLATNQTEKAWKTLEECVTRLGGLKGDPDELMYLSWICKHLPHVLPNDKSDYARSKPIRSTPPYVACQLKALSLLTDFYAQDRKFNLKEPLADDTANYQYALLQYESTKQFLKTLPETIYQTFGRFKTMGRYLEHGYRLSKTERRSLLDFYHQPKGEKQRPLGALGYEWMSLSLDFLLDERDALLAQYTSGEPLLPADAKRLAQIEQHLKNLQPVLAKTTNLELVAIDLNLPSKIQINKSALKKATAESTDSWYEQFDFKQFDQAALQRSLDVLSSTISDDDFIDHFVDYLQIALSSQENLRKPLLDYCTQTLIAKRHVSLGSQDSNIPLLCTILYRVAHNKRVFLQSKPNSFADMVKKTGAYSVPALKVYQAKDVYQEILARPEVIVVKQKKPASRPIVASLGASKSMVEQIGLTADLQKLQVEQHSLFDELVNTYQQLQEKTEKDLNALSKKLTNDLQQAFIIEAEAGKRHLATEKHKRVLAQRLLSDPLLVSAVQSAADSAELALKDRVDHFWSEALKLANQGPDEPKHAKAWAIEKASRTRETLTKADLFSLYTRADCTYIVEKTGLSIEQAQKLYDFIHSALDYGIRQQSAAKIAKTIKKGSETNDPSQAVQALDILARSEIPGLNTPAVVLLQHEEQILLHGRQVNALNSLLAPGKAGKGFNEVIEKVIMGGGKSKVIIPILVEKKARGDNLVIVEVPYALLATNHEDLNRTSQRLFGKRAYRFDFHRDSNCSPERLEEIYKQFAEIMTTKGYLVTTAESMQSLELKYLELLLADNDDEVSQQQIYWCDKITSLIRNQGDCIIDEVHQGLSIKKKLNYTSGQSLPISSSLAKNATALFRLIDPQFIKTAHELGDDFDWSEFKKSLATKLITEPTSPLNRFIANAVLKFGADVKNEILAYLSNTAKTTCMAVLQADPEEKSALAFFKQEIGVILPKTLSSRLNENYGPSKRKSLSPVERTLAIPYAGNNIANERNRFGNVLRSINFTIQMMLINGISEELLLERISQWQALARQELFQNTALKNIDETPTAKGFALLAKSLGLTLSQINLSDKNQFSALYGHFQHNKALIFDLLQEQSLKQIHHDAEIIHSDSFNHVDLYRSTQGVAGTPYNYTTYHKRLGYNKAASLGTDGYIIEVIHDKKTQVSHVDYQNVYQFIDAALSQSKDSARARAIIDLRATFLGVSNYFVAQEIGRYLRSKPGQTIRHVLYFNEDQVLCAIDINKPGEPIILATSDEAEITRLLGSTPNERFTYYDQIHTVGIDVKQDDKAHSLVLADEKTSLQAFLQGSMRMRGLSLEQSMEIIVSASLQGKNRYELIEHFEKVDRVNLLQDNLTAAQLQMTNFIRRKCLSLIQNLPSNEVSNKKKLTKIFKSFFVEAPSTDLFTLYGRISKSQLVTEILGRHQKQLLDSWQKCLVAAKLAGTFATEIEDGLHDLIDSAIPHCLKEYDAAEDSLAAEDEVQTELEIEKQIELMTLNEFYDAQLTETSQKYWPHNLSHIFREEDELDRYTTSLNKLCAQKNKEFDLFSPKLRASDNYTKVYQEQKRTTGAFLKPVFLVWYHRYHGELQATIVTPQEANDLSRYIKYSDLNSSWLSTTQDTLVAGDRPEEILNDVDYQQLREQVCFFNGEFATLLNQDAPLRWIKEQTSEKLNFFENELIAYRPDSTLSFQQIKVALTQANVEGFIYISEHPFEDLSSFDWKTLFPKVIPAQAAEYKKVAEAFNYINQNWFAKDFGLPALQQQFNLSLNSLDYVNKHLTYLQAFKNILQRLDDISIENPLAKALTENETVFLEAYFGMPIQAFYAKPDLGLPKSEVEQEGIMAWTKGDFRALLLLRAHPAIKGYHALELRFNQAILRQVTTVDDLKQLLKLKDISEDLLVTLIKHPLYDESVMELILNSSNPLNNKLLLLLIGKCKTSTQIDTFFKQRALPESFLYSLLTSETLTTAILCKVAMCPDLTEDFIQDIIRHKLCDDTVIFTLINSISKLSENLLLILAKKCQKQEQMIHFSLREDLTETVISELINKKNLLNADIIVALVERCNSIQHIGKLLQLPQTNEAVLKAITAKPWVNENVLLSVVTHSKVDTELFKNVLARVDVTPDVAIKVLERAIHSQEIVELVVSQVLDKCAVDRTGKWPNCFMQTCSYLRQNQKALDLSHIFSIRQPSLTCYFIMLDIFAMDIVKQLPLDVMITKTANEKELDLLLNEHKTGVLSEDLLLALADECSSNQFIEKLLCRFDLTKEVLHYLLQKDLSADVLLQILQHRAVTEEIRKSVYTHKSADRVVREAMRAYLQPEYLLSLFNSNKVIDADELLEILAQTSAVNENVLHVLAKNASLKQEVLLSLISHKHTNHEILQTVVTRADFSPDMAQNILGRSDTKQDIVSQVVIQTIERCNTEAQGAGTLWNDYFEQLCQFLKQKNTSEEILDIMSKSKLNIKLNFVLLDVFATEMVKNLPLEDMIKSADANELLLLLEPHKTGILNEKLMILIAERCNTDKLIGKLLGHPNITSKVLDRLVNKDNLSVKILVQSLNHKVVTDDFREKAYNHKNADRTVREAMSDKLRPEYVLSLLASTKLIEKEELLQILKHPMAVNTAVLQAIVEKPPVDQEVIASVIAHKNADQKVLIKIIEHPILAIAVVQEILVKKDLEEATLIHLAQKLFAMSAQENVPKNILLDTETQLMNTLKRLSQQQVLDLLKTKKFSSRLGLKIFRHFGEQVLEYASLSELIAEAEVKDLKLFLDIKRKFGNDELQQLALKLENASDIDKLLSRTEMNHTVADILLAKQHYSGKIANWNWLTNPQLLFILDNTSDYESFHHALIHNNLDKNSLDKWLAITIDKQTQRRKQAARSEDHKEKILAAIEVLKIKAYKHAIKALNDESYIEVADTAFKLYHHLRQEAENHFAAENPNAKDFQHNCKKAIELAQPVLNDHRGYKQSLLDILNVILAYVSFRPKTINVGNWRFFEVNTASMNLANDVSHIIEENIQIPVMVN
jgi:hypothetical protein